MHSLIYQAMLAELGKFNPSRPDFENAPPGKSIVLSIAFIAAISLARAGRRLIDC